MLRLLLALFAGLAIAGTLLMMRQQRLLLQHECNQIHDDMLDMQAQLWRQQVQIATAVAPGALKAVLADHELRAAPDGQATTPWDTLIPANATGSVTGTASTTGSTDWSFE
jgi:hypothetical protein